MTSECLGRGRSVRPRPGDLGRPEWTPSRPGDAGGWDRPVVHRRRVRTPQGKPNILVIWGDDIGISNLSCYRYGLMGYRTPQHRPDQPTRLPGSPTTTGSSPARPSAGWSHLRGENGPAPASTEGRSARRQKPVSRPEDLTIATALKAHGYAIGQFGKNHLGDRDEHLPTVHGFDEFFGNLYHLNAEEEPELDRRVGVMGVQVRTLPAFRFSPAVQKQAKCCGLSAVRQKDRRTLTGSWCRPPTCSDHLCWVLE